MVPMSQIALAAGAILLNFVVGLFAPRRRPQNNRSARLSTSEEGRGIPLIITSRDGGIRVGGNVFEPNPNRIDEFQRIIEADSPGKGLGGGGDPGDVLLTYAQLVCQPPDTLGTQTRLIIIPSLEDNQGIVFEAQGSTASDPTNASLLGLDPDNNTDVQTYIDDFGVDGESDLTVIFTRLLASADDDGNVEFTATTANLPASVQAADLFDGAPGRALVPLTTLQALNQADRDTVAFEIARGDLRFRQSAATQQNNSGEFTFFPGTPTQNPWSELEGRYGVGNAPAYRGRSFVGFTRFGLGRFGDRPPPTEFVQQSVTNFSLAGAVRNLLGRTGVANVDIDTTEIDGIEGFLGVFDQQEGGSYLNTIQVLASLYFFYQTETAGGTISFRPVRRPGIQVLASYADLVVRDDDAPIERTRVDPLEVPTSVSLRYQNIENLWQSGSIVSDPAPGRADTNRENIDASNVALRPAQAKAIADGIQQQRDERADRFRFSLPPQYVGSFEAGDVIRLPSGEAVQVIDFSIGENWVLECEGTFYGSASISATNNTTNGANAVVPLPPSVRRPGSTDAPTLTILDVPLADDRDAEIGLYAVSNRARGRLRISFDGGSNFSTVGDFVTQPLTGTAQTTLSSTPTNTNLGASDLPILETGGSVEVIFEVGATLPSSLSQAQFDAGEGNLFLVGNEYIRARDVEIVAGTVNRATLSYLARGLRGTENAIDGHQSNELVVGFSAGGILRVPGTVDDIGQSLQFKLLNRSPVPQADAEVPTTTVTVQGQSLEPLAPVDISVERDGADQLRLTVGTVRRRGAYTTGEAQDIFRFVVLDSNGTFDGATVTAATTAPGELSAIVPIAGIPSNFDIQVFKTSTLVGDGFASRNTFALPAAGAGTFQPVSTDSVIVTSLGSPSTLGNIGNVLTELLSTDLLYVERSDGVSAVIPGDSIRGSSLSATDGTTTVADVETLSFGPDFTVVNGGNGQANINLAITPGSAQLAYLRSSLTLPTVGGGFITDVSGALTITLPDAPDSTFVAMLTRVAAGDLTIQNSIGGGGNEVTISSDTYELRVTLNQAGDTFDVARAFVDDAASDNVRYTSVGTIPVVIPSQVTIAATTQASEPSTNGQFTVTLSQSSPTDTTIAYSVAGTATPGTDYTALPGAVTILANQTTATIDVTVIDDSDQESDETVVVTLSSITSGEAGIAIGTPNSATVTISDDGDAAAQGNTVLSIAPTHAYSTSQRISGATDAVQADDPSSTNIGFDSVGRLDTTQIETLANGSTLRAPIFLDQAPSNPVNLSGTTAPALTDSSGNAVFTDSGVPAIEFEGLIDSSTSGTAYAGDNPSLFGAVGEFTIAVRTQTGSLIPIFAGFASSAFSRIFITNDSGEITVLVDGAHTFSGVSADPNTEYIFVLVVRASGFEFFVNGISRITDPRNETARRVDPFWINRPSTNNFKGPQLLNDCHVYDRALSPSEVATLTQELDGGNSSPLPGNFDRIYSTTRRVPGAPSALEADDTNTTLVGFSGAEIDQGQLTTLAAGGDLGILNWVDQVSDATDFTSPTPNPAIVSGGTITLNSAREVAVEFTGNAVATGVGPAVTGEVSISSIVAANNGPFTVLVKTEITSTLGEQQFFSSGANNTNRVVFGLAANGNLRPFTVAQNSVVNTFDQGEGQPINVPVIFGYTVSASEVIFYKNGVQIGTLSADFQFLRPQDLTINANPGGGSTSRDFRGNQKVTNILLADRALSQSEVIEASVALQGPRLTGDLIRYYGTPLRVRAAAGNMLTIDVGSSDEVIEANTALTQVDTAQIEALAGSGDARVVELQNQLYPGQDAATEATTANQPLIATAGNTTTSQGFATIPFVNQRQIIPSLGGSGDFSIFFHAIIRNPTSGHVYFQSAQANAFRLRVLGSDLILSTGAGTVTLISGVTDGARVRVGIVFNSAGIDVSLDGVAIGSIAGDTRVFTRAGAFEVGDISGCDFEWIGTPFYGSDETANLATIAAELNTLPS